MLSVSNEVINSKRFISITKESIAKSAYRIQTLDFHVQSILMMKTEISSRII